jgi:hypothetical protein
MAAFEPQGLPMLRSVAVAVLLLGGCASPAAIQNPYVATAVTPVSRLALAPGGGALGDAVAAEMTALGFEVLPAETVAGLMARNSVERLNMPQRGGLGFLVRSGVDAVLEVQGPAPGEPPDSARATVIRVPDGARIAEVRWRNRFGLPERTLYRIDANGVARELSTVLGTRLRG